MAKRIETVAVVGGEIVGWSVAAALKRRLPYLSVTVIEAASAREDLANRLVCTLPSIVGFHEDIGLTEADTVARAASGVRLGTRFTDWVEGLEPYVHAYGDYGQPIDATPFHQLWLRARAQGRVPPFHHFSRQAALAEGGRMADALNGPGKGLQYGLFIDPALNRAMMQAYAEHLGARAQEGNFQSARLRGDGFIDAVLVDGGAQVAADLFIDCTGPEAWLRSQLGGDVEPWDKWLPCDRIRVGAAPPTPGLAPMDDVQALEAGWRWSAGSPRARSFGIVYSSQFQDDDAAAQSLPSDGQDGSIFTLRQMMRRDPWFRNCVAVGGSAVSIEPLEWTNLHLVHSAVDRIIAMMPDSDCAAIELSEYNRQCTVEAERVRDFLCLHYMTSNRTEPFWTTVRAEEPPQSLAHSLALFMDRGRLPFYEEETFSRDSWLAVLFGQGRFPRRVDPLADGVDPAVAANMMSRLRQMIATSAAKAPSHESYLQNLYEQALR